MKIEDWVICYPKNWDEKVCKYYCFAYSICKSHSRIKSVEESK